MLIRVFSAKKKYTDYADFFLHISAIFGPIFTIFWPISQSGSPPPQKKIPTVPSLSFSIENPFSDADSQKPISDS